MKIKKEIDLTSGVATGRNFTTRMAVALLVLATAAIPASADDRSETASKEDSKAIRPFRVNVPEAELTELRSRIKATKWPERETVADASQGVQLATMQKLARYWST